MKQRLLLTRYHFKGDWKPYMEHNLENGTLGRTPHFYFEAIPEMVSTEGALNRPSGSGEGRVRYDILVNFNRANGGRLLASTYEGQNVPYIIEALVAQYKGVNGR